MTNAWPWWVKSKAPAFPTCKNWLNFRVLGQFKININRSSAPHKHSLFLMHLQKIELEPAVIWKLVTCQRITSKNTQLLSSQYDQVILVSGQPVLTAVNWSQHGCAVSGCPWAPKLLSVARKCEIKHWFSCGEDGRSVAQVVYGHVITKFSRMDRFTLLWGSACTRLELR